MEERDMKRASALVVLAFVLAGCVTDDIGGEPPYPGPHWAYGHNAPYVIERPPVSRFSLSIGSGWQRPPFGHAYGHRRHCQPLYALDPFWSRGAHQRYRRVGVAC
jgi:hypothetical protein